MSQVDLTRVRQLNDVPIRSGARYVLYWAQINRRLDSNQAFAYAVELANRLELPLLIYEGLTSVHSWANDRFHQFVLEGVPDNTRRAAEFGVGYAFYLQKTKRDPANALYEVAKHAAAVVTDDYPGYMAEAHNTSVPGKLAIPYYVVDASCIVPMVRLAKQQYAAYTIRPQIHKLLDECLHPVETLEVKQSWSGPLPDFHMDIGAERIPELIAGCEIDHTVAPSKAFRGGRTEALRRLDGFLEDNLRRYARHNREPSKRATSLLSPYLHFGHLSSLEIALAVRKYAAEHDLIANEFLEQLIVRRELAFNFARYGPNPTSLWEALPDWVNKTLSAHDADTRDYVYSRDQWEQAETHDPLWNATQRELLDDGIIHGYYRMYWGKKIIEWSATHQQALDTMIYLNDRYALDGRDPNGYTNILWCFGLHDRPWKERAVFGMVRYMSGDGMRRKTDVDAYLRERLQLTF